MRGNPVKSMRVFAIESPSALDVLAGRTEGQTLQAVCRLLGHDFACSIVRSEAEFTAAVNHVTSINERELSSGLRGWPLCLHLAAHGDEDGLALGPDSVGWEQLAGKLRGFSLAMHHYSGPLILIISSCGAESQTVTDHFTEYAKKDPKFRPAAYVLATVSNEAGEVYWRDSLVAWSIFYHQIGAAVLARRGDIQTILDKIKLVGAGALKYFRWDQTKRKYLPYVSKVTEYKRG